MTKNEIEILESQYNLIARQKAGTEGELASCLGWELMGIDTVLFVLGYHAVETEGVYKIQKIVEG